MVTHDVSEALVAKESNCVTGMGFVHAACVSRSRRGERCPATSPLFCGSVENVVRHCGVAADAEDPWFVDGVKRTFRAAGAADALDGVKGCEGRAWSARRRLCRYWK